MVHRLEENSVHPIRIFLSFTYVLNVSTYVRDTYVPLAARNGPNSSRNTDDTLRIQFLTIYISLLHFHTLYERS